MNILLVALLAAGTTANNISFQEEWNFGNVFGCNYFTVAKLTEYSSYGCYCAFSNLKFQKDDLDRCCSSRRKCYMEVYNLESCKVLKNNLFETFYSYSYTGKEVTCSDQNDFCEDLLCRCDQKAAICFSKILYDNEYTREVLLDITSDIYTSSLPVWLSLIRTVPSNEAPIK